MEALTKNRRDSPNESLLPTAWAWEVTLERPFLSAAVSVLRSDVQDTFFPSVLLLLLVLSRLLLQSGGGYLFILELPAMVYLCIHSIVTIWQVRQQKQRNENTSHNVA